MPAPGGRRKARTSSVTPLVAVRNFNPPSFPSRTKTEATAEPTTCAEECKSRSMAVLSGAVSEFDRSVDSATSWTVEAKDFSLPGAAESLLSLFICFLKTPNARGCHLAATTHYTVEALSCKIVSEPRAIARGSYSQVDFLIRSLRLPVLKPMKPFEGIQHSS